LFKKRKCDNESSLIIASFCIQNFKTRFKRHYVNRVNRPADCILWLLVIQVFYFI